MPSRSIQRAVGKHSRTHNKVHMASAWQRYEEKGQKRTMPPSLEDEGAHLEEVMPGLSLKGRVGISQVNRRWEKEHRRENGRNEQQVLEGQMKDEMKWNLMTDCGKLKMSSLIFLLIQN